MFWGFCNSIDVPSIEEEGSGHERCLGHKRGWGHWGSCSRQWFCFLKKGGGQRVCYSFRDHNSQPPLEDLCQGRAVQDLREPVQFLFLTRSTGPTLYSLYFVQRCIGRCRYLLKSKKGICLTANCRQQIQHSFFFFFANSVKPVMSHAEVTFH